MKKFLAVFMCVMMFVSQLAVTSWAASSPAIESVEVKTIPLVEGVDGWLDYGYDENGEEVEYFYYPWEFAVESVICNYTDGTSEEVFLFFFDYEAEYVQDYDNQWTAGNSYEVVLTVEGVQCTFYVEIEENPITSIQVLETAPLIADIDGYMTFDYDEYGNEHEYFCYDSSLAVKSFQVNYNDGTSEIVYAEDLWWVDVFDDQSYSNVWGVGTYTATLYYEGRSCDFEVEIIPNTIESIKVNESISFTEYVDGCYTYDYDEDYNEVMYFEYYTYDAIISLEISHNDGTSEIVEPWELSNIEITDDQSYDNQWAVGTHTVSVSYGGQSCEFSIEIVPNEIESIEVVETIALQEEVDAYYNYDEDNYGIGREYLYYEAEPAIVNIKVTYTDGEVIMRYPNELNENFPGIMYVDSDQSYNNQWKVGNTYKATLHLYGKSCEFDVSIEEASDYYFQVIDGEIYICGWNEEGYENRKMDITIPEELFGYPVVGIENLDNKPIIVRTITIPDSVYYIGMSAFSEIDTLEKVVLGKNVAFVDTSAFVGLENLTAIEVVEENPDYTSLDGVLYNDDITSLVAYPEGKGDVYTLPATVDDINATLYYENVEFIIPEDSVAFTVVDGVIYSKDMKTLVQAPKTISGLYVMPDSVESVEPYAFESCVDLEQVIFSNALTYIGEGAFAGCTSLTAILLPEELVYLGDAAFFACTSLNAVIIQNAPEYFGSMAFFGAAEDFEIHFKGKQSAWDKIEFSELDQLLVEYNVVFYDVFELIPHVLNGRIVTTSPGACVKEEISPIKLNEETGIYMGFDSYVIKGSEDDVINESYKLLYIPEDSVVMHATFYVLGNSDCDEENAVTAFDLIHVSSLIKSDEYSKYADINFDGKVTAIDLIDISNIIKGSYVYEG